MADSADDLLGKILQGSKTTFRDAFDLATIPGMIEQQKALLRAGRRAEAQVDAALKSKYKQCGMEGMYEPPDAEDLMGDTYINCPVIGAEAVSNITAARSGLRNKPWWRWLLGVLLAVSLGAGIVYATAKYFQGDPSEYEVVAVPWNPNQPPRTER